MNIVLTSQSKVKLEAVKQIFPKAKIQGAISSAQLPAQPINSGLICAHSRIDGLILPKGADLIISIENGIDTINHWEKGGDGNHFVDICYVVAQLPNGQRVEAESFAIPVPATFVRQAREATDLNYLHRDLGYQVSAGEMIAKRHPNIDHANWMADPKFGGRSRTLQIQSALAALKI